MSVAEHETEAKREERLAAQASCEKGRVCWSAADPALAAEYRGLAARHRAAAQALEAAEAQACSGLADEDRDASPFGHNADIRSVSPYYEPLNGLGGGPLGQGAQAPSGATIVFRAVPGLTAEWLQRIINCHLARNAAVGNDMPEMPECPLVPRGVIATVLSVGDGFAVNVYSEDAAAAAEIWRRAQLIHVTR